MKQSSTQASGGNLAAQWSDAKLLQVLKELANVRNGAGASRFLQRFPDFLVFSSVEVSLPEPERMHPEAADLVNAGHTYQAEKLSKLVQAIWRGLPEGMSHLLVFFLIDDVGDALKIAEVSSWQHQPRIFGPRHLADLDSPTQRRRATIKSILERRTDDAIEHLLQYIPARDLQKRLQPDWTRQGRFTYHAATPFQKVLFMLWSKSSLAKVCKNPECPAPFFIARRVQQQYCGDECAAPFRLEAKMKWWNNVGKDRREKISKRKTRKEKQR